MVLVNLVKLVSHVNVNVVILVQMVILMIKVNMVILLNMVKLVILLILIIFVNMEILVILVIVVFLVFLVNLINLVIWQTSIWWYIAAHGTIITMIIMSVLVILMNSSLNFKRDELFFSFGKECCIFSNLCKWWRWGGGLTQRRSCCVSSFSNCFFSDRNLCFVYFRFWKDQSLSFS